MKTNEKIICCKICGADNNRFLGEKAGKVIHKNYRLFGCLKCGFTFIGNPSIDYENIYNIDYYTGKGVDPKVDYLFELEHPQETIRIYEWQGIMKAIRAIIKDKDICSNATWLDFGCGTGGFVRWLQECTNYKVMGFEESIAIKLAGKQNLKILNHQELAAHKGYFDVVTAIEVLEHTVNPLEVLRLIRSCLKPGGIFFFTTGNAEKFKDNILNWNYVLPEIHVSFFEPRTIVKAFELSGFKPRFFEGKEGFRDIITFKILKNLGLRKRSKWQNFLPWTVITNIVDNLYKVTAFPVGEAI